LESVCASLDAEAIRFGATVSGSTPDRRAFQLEEIWSSTLMAGSRLTLDEVAALVERGIASGDKPLEDYITVADYADAANWVASAPPAGRRRIFIRLEEIVVLHARSIARTPSARPGAWRRTSAPAFPSGTVPPPAWSIPREMNAFADRFGKGPAAGIHPILWVAAAHERFTRIHPFERGNGRTARLMTNLLLQRTGFPPFIVRPRKLRAYLTALQRADSRDPRPLAIAIAESVLEGFGRLRAAAGGPEALQPLTALATGRERAALYKAAQRGRLRTLRRGGTLYTSEAWITAYTQARQR